MRDSVQERLKELIDHLGLNLKQFSDQSKVPYRTLQDYLSGKNVPGGENLQKISTTFRASIDWILTGEGTLFLVECKKGPELQPDAVAEQCASYHVCSDTEIREIVEILEHDLPELKSYLVKFLRGTKERKEGAAGLGLPEKKEE